jgi:hypothetical protein
MQHIYFGVPGHFFKKDDLFSVRYNIFFPRDKVSVKGGSSTIIEGISEKSFNVSFAINDDAAPF